jgi:hypothetical protein
MYSDEETDRPLAKKNPDGVVDCMGLEIEKPLFNELLLVCSNLGTVEEVERENGETIETFCKGEDVVDWIHDLQRAIRRDETESRAVCQLLGSWKIVQTKMIPLMTNYHTDRVLFLDICKVLVMVTMPLEGEAARSLKMKDQMVEYLEAMVKVDEDGVGPITLIVQLLEEPLRHEGKERTPQDQLHIELLLTLFRNLLAIPNPVSRRDTSANDHRRNLHEELVVLLHKEFVLETILYITNGVEAPENIDWSLLLLEIFDNLLKEQDPVQLANARPEVKQQHGRLLDAAGGAPSPQRGAGAAGGRDPARGANPFVDPKRRQQSLLSQSSRHGSFGTNMIMPTVMGRKQFIHNAFADVHSSANVPQVKKRMGKKSTKLLMTAMATAKLQQQDQRQTATISPGKPVSDDLSRGGNRTVMESRMVLQSVVDGILASYMPLARSLKGLFRRESAKLIATDRELYFRVTAFLTSYYRHKQALANKGDEKRLFRCGPIFESLDLFSFRFVINAIDDDMGKKQWSNLPSPIALLKEMMTMLAGMRTCNDVHNRKVATALTNKLFYERDSLDLIPKLMRAWAPGLFTWQCIADLADCAHVVLKMLESNRILVKKKSKGGAAAKSAAAKAAEEHGDDDPVGQAEQEFDFKKYFKALVTNQVLKLYLSLLETYDKNPVRTNHHVHSFLHRVANFELTAPEEVEGDAACGRFTLEPMVYHISYLSAFNKALADPRALRNAALQPFLGFMRAVVGNFGALCERNPCLFVEALFWRSYPHRTCIAIQRGYKTMRTAPPAEEFEEKWDRRDRYHGTDSESGNDDDEEEFDPDNIDNGANEEEEGGGDQGGRSRRSKKDKSPGKGKKKKAKKAGEKWSGSEDNFLRRTFPELSLDPAVFDLLAAKPQLGSSQRTAKQVEKRVHELGLQKRQATQSLLREAADRKRRVLVLAHQISRRGGGAALEWLADSLTACAAQRLRTAGRGAITAGPAGAEWAIVPVDKAHFEALEEDDVVVLLAALELKRPTTGQWMWRVSKGHVTAELAAVATVIADAAADSGMPDPQIGARVDVLWPEDGNFYTAEVVGFDSGTSEHELLYPGSEMEKVDLLSTNAVGADFNAKADGDSPTKVVPRSSTATQRLRGEEKVVWRVSGATDGEGGASASASASKPTGREDSESEQEFGDDDYEAMTAAAAGGNESDVEGGGGAGEPDEDEVLRMLEQQEKELKKKEKKSKKSKKKRLQKKRRLDDDDDGEQAAAANSDSGTEFEDALAAAEREAAATEAPAEDAAGAGADSDSAQEEEPTKRSKKRVIEDSDSE